ncbi:MAG: CocE/NonD family hydrolase [Vicinamibacterales bacterium]
MAPRMNTATGVAVACIVSVLVSGSAARQAPPSGAAAYDRRDVMIATRDGVRLNTIILTPKSPGEPLPFILFRTPYGIEGSQERLDSSLKELADERYILVFQDIRGRYKSEGRFVMSRPPRDKGDATAIDESTDTNDTIEWLLRNVPNHNGRVGITGISYGGWLTVMGMLDPHPAVKAVSPQASPADMFLGDDFHHNGAFRLSYGFEYAAMMETSKENFQFTFDRYDTYEWYLNLGPLGNANARYFKGTLPTWNDFEAHPNYDAFWQYQAFAPHLTRVTVPTLNVAGWWDQEDFYGPMKIYDLLERHDTQHLNYLVAGPWNHGGWARGDGASLGRVTFGGPTSRYFREQIQAKWFAFHLKDKGTLDFPEALTFRTGENAWVRHDTWPPRERVAERKLYFRDGGRLSFDPPPPPRAAAGATATTGERFDAYVSDPAHPVPYRARPIEPTYDPRGSGWSTWLVEDQRFAHQRADVLSYTTETLPSDVTMSGRVTARLFASTSGTDSDWVVKLIDVYPENYVDEPRMSGYQLMIAGDVFRGRFRRSFEKPSAAVPNQVAEYDIDLLGHDHRFKAGHKIMVQVQSSWFPVIDRNPQTFVPNIFKARAADYRSATQRIYRTPAAASHVELPIVEPE